jgi:hypothetical protein
MASPFSGGISGDKMAQGEWQGLNQEEGNSRLIVEFSLEPKQDEEKTAAAGRPIYVDQEWIKIRIPGDKDNNVSRATRPGDKERFPQHWAAFQNKTKVVLEGTPLEVVPFLTKSQVLEFTAMGVRTAEQLVGIADSNAQNIMGYQSLKAKVVTFLEAAKGAAPALKLQAELEKRDSEIAMLKQMVETLGERVDSQNKASKGYIKVEKAQ